MSDPTPKEYNQILTKGTQSVLNETAIEDGKLRFTTDTGSLYLDIKNDTESKRLKISDIDSSKTEEEILSILAPLPKIYVSSDTHRAFVSNGTSMIDLAEINLGIAEVLDQDAPLWFTDKSEDATNNPKYANGLTYNAYTEVLKTKNLAASNSISVDSMKITTTTDESNIRTVEFSFS